MSRVSQAAERVSQVMELKVIRYTRFTTSSPGLHLLKSSLSQLQSCIEHQDWESATRHCARAMSLPFEVISGAFAETSVADGPPSQLQRTTSHLRRHFRLQGNNCYQFFLKQFAQAARARDAAATSRYFKLFPAIGWEAEGLEAYASFVVDLVRVRAPTSAKTCRGEVLWCREYAKCHQKVTGGMLIEWFRSTLETWKEDRSIKRKVKSVPVLYNAIELNLPQLSDVSNSMISVSASRKQFSTTADVEEVDAR
ncbi:hypothetical protein JVU11DRAFT_454 [Chiua virens]|nr:hypothetical protein JVU11DRAFT_454 [Chiua virens]